MKPLSQQLNELSDRAKKAQDAVAAVRDKNRAMLESQRAELAKAIDAGKVKAAERAEAAKGQAEAARDKVQAPWIELRQAAERRFAEMRSDADARRKEHDIKKAERRADDAEQNAAYAIDLATYYFEEAEYAVIDATLARADADDLAQRT
jgi:hypothetical protein